MYSDRAGFLLNFSTFGGKNYVGNWILAGLIRIMRPKAEILSSKVSIT
jgi:hypothetical protein